MRKIEEEAARWFARMKDVAPDHPERGHFEAWLATTPTHAAEYAAFADTWNDLMSGRNGEALAEAMKNRQERQRQSRRKMLKQGVFGFLLAGVGADTFYYYLQNQPLWQFARQTGIGQLAKETLQDGSTLVLSAGTEVAVNYTRAERHVELRTGQAIFEVTKNPERPFVVDSGAARITVLGTRFVVNRLSNKVLISVDHGRVQVDTGSFWNRRSLVLEDSQVAEVTVADDDKAAILKPLDRKAIDAFSFEQGVLMFDQADLAEIAETLSRYRKTPVRVRSIKPGAASPRIVAGIHADDVESFIDMLPRLAPVTVNREGEQVWLGMR